MMRDAEPSRVNPAVARMSALNLEVGASSLVRRVFLRPGALETELPILARVAAHKFPRCDGQTRQTE